jgi:hypothetical protein
VVALGGPPPVGERLIAFAVTGSGSRVTSRRRMLVAGADFPYPPDRHSPARVTREGYVLREMRVRHHAAGL